MVTPRGLRESWFEAMHYRSEPPPDRKGEQGRPPAFLKAPQGYAAARGRIHERLDASTEEAEGTGSSSVRLLWGSPWGSSRQTPHITGR